LNGIPPSEAQLKDIREDFTRSLTRDGIHPWVAVPEYGESGRWHLNVILGAFHDFKRLNQLWRAAAGEAAGRSKMPRKAKAKNYCPGIAANYLIKEFRDRPAGVQRVQYSFASKPRANDRYRRITRRSYVTANSLREAAAGALRQSKTVDLAYFNADAKGQRVTIEIETGDRLRTNKNSAALADYARTIPRLDE
jgi:hypothetical protein